MLNKQYNNKLINRYKIIKKNNLMNNKKINNFITFLFKTINVNI